MIIEPADWPSVCQRLAGGKTRPTSVGDGLNVAGSYNMNEI